MGRIGGWTRTAAALAVLVVLTGLVLTTPGRGPAEKAGQQVDESKIEALEVALDEIEAVVDTEMVTAESVARVLRKQRQEGSSLPDEEREEFEGRLDDLEAALEQNRRRLREMRARIRWLRSETKNR